MTDSHVVIGTAGHIDHGKTTLVKALTGVDTDRLAEEKKRGITIDLGFAPLDLDGLSASVVDVPGHEGFIRNMLAGATGIDAALLVIAADEGVMPQTREHLLILRYLGVERGVVALAKSDLVDKDWLALVAEDYRQSAIGSRQSEWPTIGVSALTGAGLPELRAALKRAALGVSARAKDGRFRLPVDRVFGLAGAGTVVTGTAWSGTLTEGDAVTVLPGGKTARVRSIEVHGRAARSAAAGRRAAIALVGVEKDDLTRGSVVLTGSGWRESRAADVVATFATVAPRLRSRVHVHHGTSDVVGRIARVGPEGPNGIPIRLMLEAPLVLRAGDRLVLRSWSPVTTIGGAIVTDPWVDQLDRARRKTAIGNRQSAIAFVTRRGRRGVTVTELEVATGLADATGLAREGDWLVAPEEVDAAAERLLESLGHYHAAHPLERGMPAQFWRATVDGPAALAALAERRLESTGGIVREGATVRLATFTAASSAEARSDMERVFEQLVKADAEPPSPGELAAGLPGLNVPGILKVLEREGRITPVADRYYVTDALTRERARLEDALRQLGPSTPAALREKLGRSRKWLIPFLEWADREGVTVRDGDRRKLNLQAGS